MRICKLTMVSSVDGRENKTIRMGKCGVEGEEIRFTYREEGAQVALCVREGYALVERVGDYSMTLPLSDGEWTKGSLSIGGSEGEIPVYTEQITRKVEEDIFIELRYGLSFGEERQEMCLKIRAQFRKDKEKGE